MKGLSQLTENIRDWNQMGLALLPTLEVAIVHSVKFTVEVIEILKTFGCHDLLYSEDISPVDNKLQDTNKINQSQITPQTTTYNKTNQHSQQTIPEIEQQTQITLQSFDARLKSTLYAIYLTHRPIQSRIHVVVDLEDNQRINDQILKKTKKIIERLKRNKSIIFVNFNPSTHKLDEMSQHIEQFGLSFRTKQRQIRGDELLYFSHPKPIIKKNKIITYKSSPQSKKSPPIKQANNNTNTAPQSSTTSRQLQRPIQQLPTSSRPPVNHKHILKSPNFPSQLLTHLQKKYIRLFGIQINKNFLHMKTLHKRLSSQLKRYKQILQLSQALANFEKEEQVNSGCGKQIKMSRLKNRMLTKHALTSMHRTKQYLVSSLMGTYTNVEIPSELTGNYTIHSQQQLNNHHHHRSLHWQLMQIINQIWDIEGDTLLKQIDKMPLSYIKERYKMLDYQTIGGFMPAACFEAIFSAPLRKMVDHIMETLEIIQMKIVAQVKRAIQYFFHHTSLCYDLSQHITQQITTLSRLFRHQTHRVLKSHIQFISVSSQEFWAFKQLNSGIYGPQQQIYIEIKYIGKNYIKKVFQSIRETLPRLVGQNLLKEIVNYWETKSTQVLTKLLGENQLAMEISNYQLQKINILKLKQRQIDNLVYYFSLKTSSEVNLKNLNQRMDKNWKRMFGKQIINYNNSQQFHSQHDQKNQGFFAWAKLLFTRTKKVQRPKRSLSQQKEEKSTRENDFVENPQLNKQRKALVLSEKNWLLIINTGKPVEQQKIYTSGCQGFPTRLRPSIWLYLSRKQFPQNILPRVQHLLDEASNTNQQAKQVIKDVFWQIDKDVKRTPPPSLFKKGYLGDSLTRVLRAYSIYDKDLQYTQGMNFVVALILCVLTHHGEDRGFEDGNFRKSKLYFDVLENNCFAIFVHMMQKKGLRKIMFIERQIITDLCIKLTSYIAKNSPVMHEKIEKSGFTIEMIFSPALISALTSTEIEFSFQKRVIDLILITDFSSLYKVVGSFVASAQRLCQKLQAEMLYFYLKGNLYNEVYKVIGDDGVTKMFKGL